MVQRTKMPKVTRLKIQSKSGKEEIFVHVKGKTIISTNMGFVPISGHKMDLSLMNRTHLKRFYEMPEGITV